MIWLSDAEDFLSHGSRKTSDRAPGPPPGPRKQPSAQFEEYIKAEITPLIGLSAEEIRCIFDDIDYNSKIIQR